MTAGVLVRYRRLVTAARLDAQINGHQLGNLIRTGGRGVGRCRGCFAALVVDVDGGVSGGVLEQRCGVR